MAISNYQMTNARKRAKAIKSHVPKAVSAGYSNEHGGEMLVVELSSSAFVGFPIRRLQGLESARRADFDVVQISPSGYGLHFPSLDADLYLPALLEGAFGSKSWMAEIGKRGGHAVSHAKKAAAQANGKLGGRPRKEAASA